jgi:alpha-1,6-mannosyltransferase
VRGVPVRGAIGSLLLALGGWCYVRLPRHTWLDGFAPLWSIRAGTHHLAWGLSLSAAGLVVLTWAWWDLWRATLARRTDLATVRRVAAVWAAPLLIAPPLFSGDGWSYVATGALAARGESPYLWTPAALPVPLSSGVSPRWQFTPSPYGPLSVAWGSALGHVTRDPWLLLEWYRLAAVLALVLLAWAVPRLARRAAVDPAEAAVLAVASPFVLVHGIGGLHNDLVMAALVLAALVATRPGRWTPGAVLAGLAAAVKAPSVVAAVGVVLMSLDAEAAWSARLRRAAEAGAVTTGVVLASGWLTGLGTGWIGALSVPDHEQTALSMTAVTGRWVHGVLEHAGPGGLRAIHDVHPEMLAKRIGILVLVAVVLTTLLRTRLGSPPQVLRASGLLLLATVVLSPVVHYWYLLWCVPVLACAPLRRSARTALVAAVVTLGLTAIGDRALRIGWLWQTSAWALVVVPAAAWSVVRLRERTGVGVAESSAPGDLPQWDAGTGTGGGRGAPPDPGRSTP